MGDVIDLSLARTKRGLVPEPTARFWRPPRPTLAQAVAQYDEETFRRAYVVAGSSVAHNVSEGLGHGQGRARCGAAIGDLSQPEPTTLVCLRCWPWWRP